MICASLWPDPGDELCPPAFRVAAVEQIKQFATRVWPAKINEESGQLQKTASPESLGRWEAIAEGTLDLDADEPSDWGILRFCLLDFIADFANWDNSTLPAYLETSRALTQASHEAFGGVSGTRPLVVDPFAGGGSIPLEALRVGADAFASDLNPVPVLLNKVVLDYIPKFGPRLAEEVSKWGRWVKDQAKEELTEYYPSDSDGSTPIAYLWARTILSEAPGQGDIPIEVPLIRSLWLCKKPNRKVAYRWKRDASGNVETIVTTIEYADGTSRRVRRPALEIFEPERDSQVESGTVARASATCPVTGYTTAGSRVKAQLKQRRGGAYDARLLCVVVASESQTIYRQPTVEDEQIERLAARRLVESVDGIKSEMSFVPNEPTPPGGGKGAGRAFSQRSYGMDEFRDLFLPRQQLMLATYARTIQRLPDEIADRELAFVIQTLLGLTASKMASFSSSLCVWRTVRTCVAQTFGRQAISIAWDFGEMNPFCGSAGDFGEGIEYLLLLIDHIAKAAVDVGQVQLSDATASPLPDDMASLFFTDPPYYDAVPYSDLSDFFYVWLRRCLPNGALAISDNLTPKLDECIVDDAKGKTAEYFERTMMLAMRDGRRIVAPAGVGVVVFAHKSTGGWESQIGAMLEAGWVITGSWPIDTERSGRLRAHESAALASSVHLVCRPRETTDGSLREAVGEWRDVLSELPQRIHEWMPRLASEGVVGADAIFACLGPALEIFSRYSRVEKASGDAVPLREYLEQVWAAVSTEALSMIFRDADAAGLEPDARLTAMWLWTLGAGTGKAGGNGQAVAIVPGLATDDEDEPSTTSKAVESSGYALEYDAARKIAQGLGIHLEQSDTIVEVKGDKARLLPVSERTRHLFGQGDLAAAKKPKKTKAQRNLFEQLDALEAESENETGELKPNAGETVLDRVHQAMILFAAGRGEALRRFLVDDGAGKDARFWKLAQSLSALYPKETDEKRWVDGVLARKKGLGL